MLHEIWSPDSACDGKNEHRDIIAPGAFMFDAFKTPMSQASFSQSARNAIRGKYRLRCVICLNHISTAQCVHILDAATPGEVHVVTKIIMYDRLALVLLSEATQSNSAFYPQIIGGMQWKMAYFVSGGHHGL